MLDGKAVDLDRARELGVSIFAGEAEGRFETLLQEAASGTLKPDYDFTDDLIDMTGQPSPFLPIEFVRRTAGTNSSFDSGRGCPYQCSFCTIINVQGRKSRSRSPDDVEKVIRENWAEGISRFFLTDDNFARNKEWEPILDRLIKLREVDKIPLGLMIQVDTLCHKIPNFIEKCQRAGVTRVFIGLENINPDNLKAVKKPQNKITEYRTHAAGVEGAGYLHLCRLHPRPAGRYAGIDPPRHRDHPARIAARYRRMGDPHPAAGFRGPHRDVEERASPWTATSIITISNTSFPTIPR